MNPCHMANVGVQVENGFCGEPAAGSEATEDGRKAIEARRGKAPKTAYGAGANSWRS